VALTAPHGGENIRQQPPVIAPDEQSQGHV
jgi:hypothetical protein